MKKIVLQISVLLVSYIVHAQQEITGKIFDAVTSEPLPGATVTDEHNRVSIAGASGEFKLITADTTLTVSYTGYKSRTYRINNPSSLSIALTPVSGGLQQVVVSASRTAQKRSDVPVAISTINKQTLEDTKATRLDQLVNKVSGVYMVNLGNEQHSMSIRQPMTTKSLFLYLEDGIPIRTTGLYNHNALLEMNMTAAKQIEIIKGPASSLYGAEAIGGAVNVITQSPPVMPKGSVSIQANNTGYKRADIQAGNTFGKLGVLLSGYYANRHNGPIAHSDFHKTALTLRTDYRINATTSWTNSIAWVDYVSDMTGSPDSVKFSKKDYSTLHTFTNRTVKAFRYKSQLEKRWNSNSETQASFIFRDNSIGQIPSYRVKNAAGNPSLAHGEINESTFNSYMLLLQHKQLLNKLNSKLVAGVSVDISPGNYWGNYIQILRDAEGDYISYTTTDSVLSQYSTHISNLASYVHYEWSPVQGLKLVAALRYDYYHYNFDNDLSPSFFTGSPDTKNDFSRLTPKLGATYNYKGLGVYANYSQGFVPPQVSELYQGVQVPVLGPQTFFNYEAGGWLSLLQHKLYADWSVYRLNGNNEIITVRHDDGSFENRNAGKTQHTGIEYGVTYKPVAQWSFRFSGAGSKHSFTDYVEKGISYNGNEMAGAPRFIGNAEVVFKPNFLKGFRIGAEWQQQGSYYMDAANSQKYKGYSLLNLRTGYATKKFEVWVNVLNITDTYYAVNVSKATYGQSYSLGDPREITVGIAYKPLAKTPGR